MAKYGSIIIATDRERKTEMKLEDRFIILASDSPRRIEMLKERGAEFCVLKAACDEDISCALSPEEEVMALAFRKNMAAERLLADAKEKGEEDPAGGRPYMIISGDTLVHKGGRILGKPADREEAEEMLRFLRGEKNTVCSGVCVSFSGSPKKLLFFDSTDVYFKDYGDEDIRAYVDSGEPMDKAGAYAIQEGFGRYLDHLDGHLDNVIGFPLEMLEAVLAKADKL